MTFNDIAKKYILGNKKNTILIILSIIISTTLFLVVNIISEDARNLMIDQSKKELGMKHAWYNNPTNQEVSYLKDNSNIDKLGKSMLLGFHSIGKGQTLQILSQDKISETINNNYILKSGNLPTKENEIAIDQWYIDQKKIKNPIGQTLNLDYKNYDLNGNLLYSGKKEFTVVGILKANPILKSQGMSIASITESCAKKNIPLENKYDQVMFTFKNETNIQKQVQKLIQDGNLQKDKVELNQPLISAMSDSLTLKTPYIIVDIILALATILLIYNIFYILVSNRTKDFGVLRALGFIPFDISKIIMLEVFMYSSISITIGLLLGSLISNLSREYIIGVIYNIKYVESIKNNSYLNVYIFSLFLSLTTVLISVINPLISLSKIDPMICIRRNDEKLNIKQDSFINRFMTKFFRDYGNLASKNIHRNKKRTFLAIASMTIVIFLMATVYTQATSNFLNNGGLKGWIPGDYLIQNIDIYSRVSNDVSYNDKTLKSLENIEGVVKVNAYRDKNFKIKINQKNLNKNSDYWKQNRRLIEQNSEVKNGIKSYINSFEVLGIQDNDILDEVLIDGRENIEKLDKNPYIYIDKNASSSLNLKKGDSINLDFTYIDPKTNNYKGTLSKKFIIGGIITQLPINSQAGSQFSAVISTKQFNKFTGISSYERFDVWTSKIANNKYVERELNEIIEKTNTGIVIPYKAESAEFEKIENQKTLLLSLVIGVIVILSLFNCCNTIITNINSRNREFALLRGIGISKDEIDKIVKLEGLIYILASFSLAIIPTLLVRSFIIKEFDAISLINFKFLFASFLILTILTFIIIITISITLKQIQQDNFIEQIKTLE